MLSRISSLIFGLLLLIAATTAPAARAQGINIVRDAEIEDIIRAMATPLFKVAGLDSTSIKIFLVNDRNLNAFVADGLKLFINTGLLMKAASPEQVIGVIAHETGHMAGGHLSRFGKAVNRGGATALIGAILGGAAALSTGRGDVGGAIALAGQHLATREFLTFTRTQEASADQAALRFLDVTGQSAAGLLEFLNTLGNQELLISENQDPYVRTHPLTSDRVETIANHLKQPGVGMNGASPEMRAMFERMQAKLIGYFDPPQLSLRRYPPTDVSVAGRYARAFAYAKAADVAKAVAEVEGLLSTQPDDPFFLELKSQILFESGNVKDAISPMRRAVGVRPNETLFLQELGRMLIEFQDPAALDEAIQNLERAIAQDRDSATAWRYLGIAYGRKEDIGRSSLALGEYALLIGEHSQARFHSGRALKLFSRGSREWLHAEDIQNAAKKKEK